MKILQCIPVLDHGGGAERQLSYLAYEQAKRGHHVHVAFSRRGAYVDHLRPAGVVFHDVGGRGNHDPRILIRLIRLIASLRPNLVQTTAAQMDILGGTAALLTGTPWILREPSSAPSYGSDWKSRLRRMLGAGATAIVSNSRGGDAYWSGAHTRYVIPNGLPFDEIGTVVPNPDNVVLFAGRLNEGKNAATLLDALAHVGADFTAVICGDGPQRDELQQKADARVVFTGLVTDLWERMRHAAVVVSLSHFEGCPNVVMEAMACGVPLVVSDIPAHRELLADGMALFVGADDVAAAAQAIEATLLDREAAKARARAARAHVAHCSIDALVRHYDQVYRDLA